MPDHAERTAAQPVCHRDDIWEGDKVFVDINGVKILLTNINGTILAYQGWCPHQAQSLEDADLDGCRLTCTAHLWEFDLTDGKGINPKTSRLRQFPVQIDDDGNVYVHIQG